MAIEDRMQPGASVDVDVAADGSVTDSEGCVDPVWERRLDDLLYLVVENTGKRAPSQDITEDFTTATILFARGSAIPRDESIRIGIPDVGSGKVIHYFSEAKPKYVLGGDPAEGEAYISVAVRLGAIA